MAIDTKYRPRALDLVSALGSRSLFLFGPRQTGKSTLAAHVLPGDVPWYTLLDSDTYLTLSQRPARLREEIDPECALVVIDEIQKLPSLLDEVHLLIEQRGTRFLLTGSSARKLRRGGVNLLGGRARSRTLHPFVAGELGEDFDLLRALNWGLLPSVYLSDSPAEDIRAYVGDYLTQEIAAEGLTRNVPAFSRFLEVAALCSGQLLNYAAVASDAQVARSTVQEYFHILYDTLVAFELPAWRQTTRRKPIVTSKFYLFDGGVTRYLQRAGKIRLRSPQLGAAFESYIFHELKTYVDYRTVDCPLAYWRSKSGFEVDFILGDRVAIEVKAKETIGERDLRGLRALIEEANLDAYVVVTMERRRRQVDGIELLPWRSFLERLWSGAWVP
jgi:predicted AAA+ superfamily ATPase